MNTAALIERLGPELGVYGVAVHAFVEARPDCRYDEIAAGLSMSKAQVLRTVTKLEEVGAVERVKDTTDFGTSKPTVVRCLSQIHQQTSVSTSATPVNTDASDKSPINMGVSHSDSVSHSDTHSSLVSPTETPVNTGAALSDASNSGCLPQRHPPKQGKAKGTKVAPYSDIRTSTDIPQPTVEAGADAPPPAPSKKDQTAISKLSEGEREVLEAWRSLVKAYPPEYAWPTILGRLTEGFDRVKFKRCGGAYLTHIGRGQRYVGGILDWYDRDQTEPERNANATPSQNRNGNRPAKERPADNARRTAEYFGLGGKAGGAG